MKLFLGVFMISQVLGKVDRVKLAVVMGLALGAQAQAMEVGVAAVAPRGVDSLYEMCGNAICGYLQSDDAEAAEYVSGYVKDEVYWSLIPISTVLDIALIKKPDCQNFILNRVGLGKDNLRAILQQGLPRVIQEKLYQKAHEAIKSCDYYTSLNSALENTRQYKKVTGAKTVEYDQWYATLPIDIEESKRWPAGGEVRSLSHEESNKNNEYEEFFSKTRKEILDEIKNNIFDTYMSKLTYEEAAEPSSREEDQH